jgi:hypothetical protein
MPTQGPFPRELFSHPPVNTEYEQVSGNGGPEVPWGSTAQNNFKPYRWFKCTECRETIKEPDLESHICRDEPVPSYIGGYSNEELDDDDDDYDDEDEDWDDEDISS